MGPARPGPGDRFIKDYNENKFGIAVRVVKVAKNGVLGAENDVLELKFSLFAHRTIFFAAKKNSRVVERVGDDNFPMNFNKNLQD